MIHPATIRKIIFPTLLVFLQCSSVEFVPDPEYPNRRIGDVEKVIVYARKPDKPIETIGRLVFRNYFGNPGSEEFKREIELEAIKRGAPCAYISKRSLTRHTAFQTNAVDKTNRHGGQTGEIQSDVEMIEVTLFRFKGY